MPDVMKTLLNGTSRMNSKKPGIADLLKEISTRLISVLLFNISLKKRILSEAEMESILNIDV